MISSGQFNRILLYSFVAFFLEPKPDDQIPDGLAFDRIIPPGFIPPDLITYDTDSDDDEGYEKA